MEHLAFGDAEDLQSQQFIAVLRDTSPAGPGCLLTDVTASSCQGLSSAITSVL